MELIGIPRMIILGEKSFKDNKVEFKIRGQEKISLLVPEEIEDKL